MEFTRFLKKIRIVDLSGVPNEVAGAASSVIARTLFSLKLWQTREERENNPVLLVCEEAHRYVQKDEDEFLFGYNIFDRVAKEGRKYGIILNLISQRPVDLSETVISQCSNFIIFKMSHPRDIDYITRKRDLH